jgi:apolipoprotein N-acyltransferase
VRWELARARPLTGEPWLLFCYALVGSDWLMQTADELQTAATLQANVVPMRVETVYQRYGDAVAYGCALLSVVSLAQAFASRLRTSSGSGGGAPPASRERSRSLSGSSLPHRVPPATSSTVAGA